MTRAVLWGALVLAAAFPAGVHAQQPAKPQTASLDSEAPPGSPPHWLPSEPWVMQHWIPYDERRLYRLLGAGRQDIWTWLRDDTRSIADLARTRGWDARELARALVAPWRGRLEEPSRLALLERRALSTLTQGHLAQHIFFHSLHQEAIPSRATEIFGVASRDEWSYLRRSELSPLMICRLNGLPRSHAQRAAEARLRSVAAAGVRSQSTPATQARRLLARQLQQLPRWLQQSRYNGPPPLASPRESPATAANYSNNAALSRDGGRLTFESYEANLSIAKTRGEIAVMTRGPGAAGPRPASAVTGLPTSNYNPAIAADGRRIAYESSTGNLNFAKRYGEMHVLVSDLARDRIIDVSHPPGRVVSGSAYNPTISGDGRLVAFESYRRPESSDGHASVIVRDLARRTSTVARAPAGAGDPSEPRLSADGRRLAFTALVGRGAAERSTVFVRDLRGGRTRRASGAAEEAWEPVLSSDGAVIAYSAAGAGGSSHVVVRDLRSGATTVLESPAGDGIAYEPSLSDDGSRVAFVARPASSRRTQVFAWDAGTGAVALVSRSDGAWGAPAFGTASHPSISGDGRRVAFTSDAWNLSGDKCNSARGVFVRDLAAGRTRLVSEGDGANRYIGPTRGSSGNADAFVHFLCAPTGRDPRAT